MKRIENLEDIKHMVNSFYEKVQRDPLIGPVFHGVIKDNWPTHLDTMYRFWNAALFQVREYSGNPFLKHAAMPLEAIHFQRWLDLFNETVDSLFEGEVAEDAKFRAHVMASTFTRRITENK